MNIKSKARKFTASMLAAVMLIGVGSPVAVFAGYAPSARPTYQCVTPTNCPGADHVVFNSFTNAPNYGDERAFFDGKDAADTSANGYLDNISVHDGQKLMLRTYIHNNANPNAIGVDAATAKNTSLKVLLPKNKATSTVAAAEISADNANPGTVSDTVGFSGASPFTVTFDPANPAQITYRPGGTGDFVTAVARAASYTNPNTLNANFGDWHGCFEFSALVTMTVIVHMDTNTPQVPTYTCDLLNVTADVNRSVKVSAFATTAKNGATFKTADLNWGDNSAVVTSPSLVGQKIGRAHV